MSAVVPYPVLLEQAWQDAHLPRQESARTVLSTFAGCGGSSLGYAMAGWREVGASEWDPHACQVFRANFPTVPLAQGDIAQLTVAQALALSGLTVGELDCLDGSPPCQGFSTAGKRDLADPRSRLFLDYVRLLEGLRPRSLVMENVSGMVKGKMRATFVEVLRALTDTGYVVRAALLDARYFGVPQGRQRLIFVGLRDDLAAAAPAGHPWHPSGHGPVRTVADAWQDLEDPGRFEVPRGRLGELTGRLRPGQDGADVLDRHGFKPSYFSLQRLRWHTPAPTVIKSGGLVHPDEDRYLGVRELSRLQSFPDGFDWGSSKHTDVTARIGNSVPPLLMRAVAGHLAQMLDRAEALVA